MPLRTRHSLIILSKRIIKLISFKIIIIFIINDIPIKSNLEDFIMVKNKILRGRGYKLSGEN